MEEKKYVRAKRYGLKATVLLTQEEFDDLNKKAPGQFVIVAAEAKKTVKSGTPAIEGQSEAAKVVDKSGKK